MHPNQYGEGYPGQLVTVMSRTGKRGWAYIPNDLPPNLIFDQEIAYAAERAAIALGNLNGSGRMLPNPTLLMSPFMSREALASSRIEGTRAEFGQLVLLEASDEHEITDPDIQEVSNYIAALHAGWHKPKERPFSTGFLMELHQQLLSGVRGSTRGPGELREIQVMIGSALDDLVRARFVPPPPEMVRGLLDDLCAFIESDSEIPALVKLALVHYQFETIHPFQDGNGRLGRLIMPLLLGLWGDLDLPLLYLSEFFEDHRDEYVDRMLAVSQCGEWKEWILFTLKAVEEQANDAVVRGRQLLRLREELRQRYQGSRSGSIVQVIDMLFERPSLTIRRAAEQAGITYAAASRIVSKLEEDGVLEEVTGHRRNRVYLAPDIITAMVQRRSQWDFQDESDNEG